MSSETGRSRTAAPGRHAFAEPATCPSAALSVAYPIAVGRDRQLLADMSRSAIIVNQWLAQLVGGAATPTQAASTCSQPRLAYDR